MPTTVPAPATVHDVAPCTVCGLDYTATPTDPSVLRTRTTCNCDDCRRDIASAPSWGYMQQWSALYSRSPDARPRAITLFFCAQHGQTLMDEINAVELCRLCSTELRPSDEQYASSPILNSLRNVTTNGTTRTLRGLRFSGNGDSRMEVGNARRWTTPTDYRGRVYCEDCIDNSMYCEHPACGNRMQDGNDHYCEEHQQTLCYDHYYSEGHRACRQRSSVQDAREIFEPRLTIAEALRRTASPGVTVLSTRAIGIEVETARGRVGDVISAEPDALVPVLAAVGTDGSVNGANAVEFRLLPLRGGWVEYGIRSIHDRCAFAGYQPDNSAGVHMHVDASDLEAAQVWRAFAALVAVEPVLFSLATPARRSNAYCVPYGVRSAEIIAQALSAANDNPRSFDVFRIGDGGFSRYMAINAQAYSGHHTLEVRVFDSAHDAAAQARYTLAAALISGAVDFAASDAGAFFLHGDNFLNALATSNGGASAFLAALTDAGALSTQTGWALMSRLTTVEAA